MNEPESMEDLVYFTNRTIDAGQVTAWVYRNECPQCKKGIMGKPVVKGKVKMRASQYVCPDCGHTVEKQEYEDTLTIQATYTCPSCGKKGETEAPFIRKKVKGVEMVRLPCQHCDASIDITKKMKKKKD